jgi:hypothetical protein
VSIYAMQYYKGLRLTVLKNVQDHHAPRLRRQRNNRQGNFCRRIGASKSRMNEGDIHLLRCLPGIKEVHLPLLTEEAFLTRSPQTRDFFVNNFNNSCNRKIPHTRV